MNNRRKIVFGLGAGVLAGPFGTYAQQQGKVWLVGFLSLRARPDSLDAGVYGAFRQGLRELGYVEGKNLVIEWRFAGNKPEHLPELAAELIQRKVDVILSSSAPATRAAQNATATIPVVMGGTGDPVGSGFVKSLARPGGNITGLSTVTADLGPKHLEMLRNLVPKLVRVAVLVDPANPAHVSILKRVEAAAPSIGLKIVPVEARTPQEIERALSNVLREKAGALIVNGALFNSYLPQIAEFTTKHRLASISAAKNYVDAGGLASYGANSAEMYRHAAIYVDRIFKGAKAGDLPVEQPTKFELLINGKTAKAIGLKIPDSLLARVDTVIE